MMDKSWLEVEMGESVDLLRKRLEEINNISADRLDENDIHEMHEIYKTLHMIKMLKA